ncbi:MAG: phosphodiester glycosidase family protein [Proteiniphilum sp.]
MKSDNLFLILLALLTLFGCKEENEQGKALTAISVTSEKVSLAIGNSQQIKAEPIPSDADKNEMPFLWESKRPEIATVSQTGTIQAISAGITEITISARTTTKINKKIEVTVISTDVPLTAISVSPETVILEVGQGRQVIAKPEPAEASGISFKWSSNDESVASISASGFITGKSVGTATVTVKSGNIEKNIPVTVSQPPLRISIGSVTYNTDTLNYEEISEGVRWLKFKIPEFVNGFGTLGKGLVINSLEVDITQSGNKVEVCPASQATWGNVERPTVMYSRKLKEYSSSGTRPIAVINGDFYLLSSGNKTGYAYINNRPIGAEVSNGMVIQTPFSSSAGFIIRDDGTPGYSSNVSFSGQVTTENEAFPLKEVNGYANAGELVLFNNLANSYPTDSAFVWSPYVSTMVSLSHPKDGWRVNDAMEFTVTGIDYNIETTIPAASPYKGKDFNGQGAILVGNASSGNDSKTFLGKLNIGDKINVRMEIKINGNNVSDKYLNVVGYDGSGVILQNGSPVNTWNEAHPRTAIGYSQDGKKVYMIVIDGRQDNFSAGATTGQVGAIMKALGAYTAVNLDGGGSSCMVINGNVKNSPSDGSERAVANGVMVMVNK